MFHRILAAWLLGLGLQVLPVAGQPTTRVRLLADHDEVPPGTPLQLAVEMQMAPGWHTYWRTPSDSGLSGQATTVEWVLPAGVTAGEILWPVPDREPEELEPVYAYSGRILLLVPLTVAPSVAAGPLELRARVKWLECEKACVPGRAEVVLRLQVGGVARASSSADDLRAARSRLAREAGFPVDARWVDRGDDARLLALHFPAVPGRWAYFPHLAEGIVFGEVDSDRLPAVAGAKVLKQVKREGGAWPDRVAGLLVLQDAQGHSREAYSFSAPVSNAAGVPPMAEGGVGDPATVSGGFWGILGLAFLGGMILNIMPCVLPVIALKILGFVRQSQQAPGRVRFLGLMYGAGVLASFLVLAALVVGVKAAGGRAAWGMQFQNPVFLVVMTSLVLLVALNLFGLFEVHLGGRALDAAHAASAQEGGTGAFFNGVLATLLATPCTAPFLGVSLGYAFAQPPLMILVFFLAIGAGLAAPYVVLCLEPRWLRFLPKPGDWMVRFKVLMGFPLLATAVWLFGLAIGHYGVDKILWLGGHLVVLGLMAWIYGEFIQSGASRGWLAWAFLAGLGAATVGWVLEREVDWRHPAPTTSAGEGRDKQGIAWTPWSAEAVERGLAAGRPVLVDFTARWCTTCQLNKRRAIEVPEVAARIRELGVTTLLGDFTSESPVIAAELQRWGRAGVPLVLVYSRDRSRPPRILPEFPLHREQVLAALEWAAQGLP
ncbi:MAG: protein-disulfide reductase DsbD family protein [Verrucomicrobiota bacterium]